MKSKYRRKDTTGSMLGLLGLGAVVLALAGDRGNGQLTAPVTTPVSFTLPITTPVTTPVTTPAIEGAKYNVGDVVEDGSNRIVIQSINSLAKTYQYMIVYWGGDLTLRGQYSALPWASIDPFFVKIGTYVF